MLSLLLQISRCFSTSDGPVTAQVSILPVVPLSGASLVDHRRPDLISEAVSGPGGARDAWA
ncbi:MAG: hypothetical protein QOI89_3433, partial [Solirubrobacteraceae bacterium]|nr:hypothetical protein [Solirubrobacteraceae bacterium]